MSALISPTARFGYIPGLDGMRAIAVLIVMVAHFGLSHIIPGGFGVTVFFFISGFLITRLLLAESEKDGRIGLKNFYIRRFLRLLPALYFMLLVTYFGLAFLGARPGMPETIAAATYTMNYYDLWLTFNNQPQVGPWGHLWSLAVEEHFYLLYPLVLILFGTNLKGALRASMAICGLVLAWRLIAFYGLNFPGKYNYAASDARFDSIVYGCVLSLMMHLKPDGNLLKRITGFVPFAGAIATLLVCFLIRDEGFRQTVRYSLQGLALFVVFRNLYFWSTLNFAARILEWKPLALTGKISYGLYLWHIPIALVLDQYSPVEYGGLSYMAIAMVLTYAISWFSFQYVEKPVVSLRRKFGSHIVKPPSDPSPVKSDPINA